MHSKQGFPVVLILSGNADYLHQIPDTVLQDRKINGFDLSFPI